MERIALFPGSFDPIHNGHLDIIERSAYLFDKIIIGIGNNSQKKYLFDIKKRTAFAKQAVRSLSDVQVMTYKGLTINFCLKIHAHTIIRGLRSSADFEYEKSIAQTNEEMEGIIRSVFIMGSPRFSHISSSILRDIIINDGEVELFIPFKLWGVS